MIELPGWRSMMSRAPASMVADSRPSSSMPVKKPDDGAKTMRASGPGAASSGAGRASSSELVVARTVALASSWTSRNIVSTRIWRAR